MEGAMQFRLAQPFKLNTACGWSVALLVGLGLSFGATPSAQAWPSGQSAFGRAKNRAYTQSRGFGRNHRRSRLPLYQRERLDRRRNTVLRDRSLVRRLKRRPLGARVQKTQLRRKQRLHTGKIGAANVGHGQHLRAARTHGVNNKQMRRIRRLKLSKRRGRSGLRGAGYGATPTLKRSGKPTRRSVTGKRRRPTRRTIRRPVRPKAGTRGGWKVWKR
jgi:hypothetical protein